MSQANRTHEVFRQVYPTAMDQMLLKLPSDIPVRDSAKIVNRYTQAVIDNLAKYNNLREGRVYKVSLKELYHATGRYGCARGQQYWFKILNQYYPLFSVVNKGRQGSLTQVMPRFNTDILEALELETVAEQAKTNPELFDWTPIDLASLESFIMRTHTAKLRPQAERIYDLAERFEGRLPQQGVRAASGRMYYRGSVNLQTTSRVVRSAALGTHHAYDLNTGMYAWQLAILRSIDNVTDRNSSPAGTLYTREYIREKTRIRQELSELLAPEIADADLRLKLVKQAITAIGFGCRRSNTYYDGDRAVKQGLASIINRREARERFLADPWVSAFIAEQDVINRRIWTGLVDRDPSWKTDPACKDSKGKFSWKKLLAHKYQSDETTVMEGIMQLCAESEVLLWVHDCFYTRYKIDFQDVNYRLQTEYGPEFSIDVAHKDPWRQANQEPPHEQQAREHLARIQAEEAQARSLGYGGTAPGLTEMRLRQTNRDVTAEFKTCTTEYYQDEY